MQLILVEEDKERMKIEIKGDETFTHILARQVWDEKGEGAAVREHPFMLGPKIIVKGKNPRKILERSGTAIEEQCDEFKEGFKRALK